MLGSYSYLNSNKKWFSYTTTITAVTTPMATTGLAELCETHYFAIMPVDEDIAVLHFFTIEHFVRAKPVLLMFMLTGGPDGGLRRAFQDCFFLNQTSSYKLHHTGLPVLHMSHQKQKSLAIQNRAVIHPCSHQ